MDTNTHNILKYAVSHYEYNAHQGEEDSRLKPHFEEFLRLILLVVIDPSQVDKLTDFMTIYDYYYHYKHYYPSRN